ncbi:MAG: DUF4065 domain-containing protein [Oscillospiraceae bacterium]|nr:DUF4065 domain-containing protein [Oscillospiraceae bacterium]
MTSRELDIAVRYFINELHPDTLKLQKLLYFTQGISYCMCDEEFFSEQFQAWVHGPVIPEVYYRYKKYGRTPINLSYSMPELTVNQGEVLEHVKEIYGKYSGKQLESLTHKQDPWLNARKELMPDERNNKTISKQSIADYFIGLMFQPTEEIWL